MSAPDAPIPNHPVGVVVSTGEVTRFEWEADGVQTRFRLQVREFEPTWDDLPETMTWDDIDPTLDWNNIRKVLDDA